MERARHARDLEAPRVDHDQARAAQSVLADAGSDHRVVLGHVRAEDEHRARELDVVERAGGSPRTEHLLERVRRRRMTHAPAAVDVVRTDDGARELLRDVVLLVGGPRRAEHRDGVRPVLLHDGAQAPRDERDGLGPGSTSQPRRLTDERRREAVGGLDELERVPALDAEVALVHRRIEGREDLHDAPFPRAHVELAPHAAVRARRPGAPRRGPVLEERLVLERARGTRADAGAAAHARAAEQRGARVGSDDHLVAAVVHFPHELPLQVVADAHAAQTVDAARHVDADVGVRCVDERRVLLTSELAFERSFAKVASERVLFRRLQRLGRQASREHLERRAAVGVDERRPGADDHPIGERRTARRRRGVRAPVDLDDAHGADRGVAAGGRRGRAWALRARGASAPRARYRPRGHRAARRRQ